MVKMRIFISVSMILFILLNLNKSYGSEHPVNIIVILDTSDRISKEKHPGQVERDKEIVRTIVDLFDKLVSSHLKSLKQGADIKYPHRLTFAVPNQPHLPSVPQDIMRELTIAYDEDIKGGKDQFLREKKELLEAIDELYAFFEKQSKLTGADIWDWFRVSASHYLKDGSTNRIICLSDGYLNFDKDIEKHLPTGRYMKVSQLRRNPKWREGFQGFLPIKKDFGDSNTKFLMVEITLRKNPSGDIAYTEDFEIIQEYWNQWLKSMGIDETNFVEQVNPDILKDTIESFIAR